MGEYTTKGSGPLAGGVTGTAFLSHASVVPTSELESLAPRTLNLLSSTPPPTHPGLAKQLALQTSLLLNPLEADLQFNFGATGMNSHSGNSVSQFFEHGDEGGYAGITTVLTHAFSRGSVHIQSADPDVHPVIDPRYLNHPVDAEVLVDGLMFTQTIASAFPLSELLKDTDPDIPDGGKRIQPSFAVPGRLSRERAMEIVKESSATSFHPVGTCSMLPEDEGGVVSERLRVYGTRNLRVVDASVVPLNVRGNIASAVYAIAERAADLIKEDRKGKV